MDASYSKPLRKRLEEITEELRVVKNKFAMITIEFEDYMDPTEFLEICRDNYDIMKNILVRMSLANEHMYLMDIIKDGLFDEEAVGRTKDGLEIMSKLAKKLNNTEDNPFDDLLMKVAPEKSNKMKSGLESHEKFLERFLDSKGIKGSFNKKK